MHREETVTHERDLSQKSVERTPPPKKKNHKRHLTKFSRQDDLAPIRKAEKDSTANLQQPRQLAQYLPSYERQRRDFCLLQNVYTDSGALTQPPVSWGYNAVMKQA